MHVSLGNRVLFSVSRAGVNWRWGSKWFRLRAPWAYKLYSERYGRAVIARFLGWRLSVRQTGRPWHEGDAA